MARGSTPHLNSAHAYRAHKRRRLSRARFKIGSNLLSNLRRSPGFLVLCAVGVLVAWETFAPALGYPTSAASAIVGRASVIDGDTIDIGGERIRLHGIDAPESRQLCQDRDGRNYRCGQRAATALAERIGDRTVSCAREGTDRYGRVIAVCETEAGDLNGWLVREGWAVAYSRYSLKYVPVEITARVAGRGIWAGRFIEPETWRRRHRR